MKDATEIRPPLVDSLMLLEDREVSLKVRLQSIVQDPLTARQEELRAIEGTDVEDDEQFFLDGPVGRQVAVVDLDDRTGALVPGAVFQPPSAGRKLGRYLIADEQDLRARDLNQVSVYTTVLNTMAMSVFERTKEIAMLRALGWKRRRIVGLILGEATMLSAAGALIGIVFAVVAVKVLSGVPASGRLVSGEVSVSVMLQGVALALMLGLLGGLYPAWAAAKLPPVEGLRHD